MTGTRTGRLVVVAAVTGTLLLSACSRDDGRNASDLVADAQARQYAQEQVQQRQVQEANAALAERVRGQVDIDGDGSSSITSEAVGSYRGTGTETTVDLDDHGDEVAFQRLCEGKVDVVSSTRSITRSEWDACQAVGLDVVQFHIASDAILVAIKSESDVGGDCLTTDEVQEIWRAGSPVTSWGQLGLDDVPLEVGGPELSTPDAVIFGKAVLGSPAPAQADVRSDYAPYGDFDEALRFLTGGEARSRLALGYADRARARGLRKSELDEARQVHLDARDELEVAMAERAKGIRDNRPAGTQAKDQARVDEAWTAVGTARADVQEARQSYLSATARWRAATKAKRAVDATVGNVIYLRFSDYQVYEDRLRPFEISLPDEQNCVFPSQLTITGGQYPFAAQTLATTTTRSLARTEVKDFLRHYLNASQGAAAEARLLPVPVETLRAQLAWLDGSRDPVLVTPLSSGDPSSEESPGDGTASDPAAPAR